MGKMFFKGAVNGVPVIALEQTGESSNESTGAEDQVSDPQEDPIATTPPHFITVTGEFLHTFLILTIVFVFQSICFSMIISFIGHFNVDLKIFSTIFQMSISYPIQLLILH